MKKYKESYSMKPNKGCGRPLSMFIANSPLT